MKLLVCRSCSAVISLKKKIKYCDCGASSGYYIDNLNAVIYGPAIPLGFSNGSFVEALRKYPFKAERGERFDAFVIPEDAPTVKLLSTQVAKSVDAADLKSADASHVGSTPALGTKQWPY